MERPVRPGRVADLGDQGPDPPGELPVHLEVVAATEEVVVEPGRGRDTRVDTRRDLVSGHERGYPLTVGGLLRYWQEMDMPRSLSPGMVAGGPPRHGSTDWPLCGTSRT